MYIHLSEADRWSLILQKKKNTVNCPFKTWAGQNSSNLSCGFYWENPNVCIFKHDNHASGHKNSHV